MDELLSLQSAALIAFDFDGTLVEHYYPVFCKEAVRLLPELGGPRMTLEQALKAHENGSLFDFAPSSERDAIEAEVWRRWDRSLVGAPRLISGARECLDGLVESGRRIALVTSRVEPNCEVRQVVAQVGLLEYFSEIVSLHGRDHSWQEKETMLRDVCLRLDVDSKATVMVGDDPTDMMSARRFGAQAVGVLTGGISSERLLKAGAHTVIPSIGGLSSIPAIPGS
jgi:phosphoglycolate phosphatase-like HAD superfamily hydrolase